MSIISQFRLAGVLSVRTAAFSIADVWT